MPTVRPRHIPRRPADEPIHTRAVGMDFEKRRLFIAAKSIVANMISDGALDYGLSFYAEVTTYTDTTHFKAAGLAAKGTGAFKTTAGTPYEIYVFQADAAAPEGQMTPVVAYTSSDGTFQHAAFSGGNVAVGDIVLVIHPLLASLGTKASTAATGAVTTTDYLMAYMKQQITLQIAADIIAGNIVDDITAAVDEPPTAKSLQDILHKDTNYTYSKATDALEALSDELHRLHQHIFILFIIPEAVASINADNLILQAELAKLGHLHTITQADALDFPAFGMYGLAICGTNSGTAWTTTNLADLKSYLGLPIVCVDKVAAAYFEIGTDGGDAATKTVIRAISEIEGTVIGIGESAHEIVTGLAAGNNTVSSSATYHTLTMVDADITEKVFCTETEDPDGGTANTDVVMGLIPRVLDDGSIGVDEEGADVPASLGFLGFCYDASELTTLGKGAFYLFCHMMIMTKVLAVAGEATAVAADIRNRLFGNMKNLFTSPAPLVEYIAGQNSVGTKLPVGTSLYDVLLTIAGYLDTEIASILAAVDTEVAAIETKLDTPANFMADVSALALEATLGTHDTDIKALLATIAGYIDTEIAAIIADTEDLQGNVDAMHDTDLPAVKTVVDANAVLVAAKAMGRLQIATTTEDLNQVAGTYDLFTGTDQAVVLEKLNVKMPTGAAGGSVTSIAIVTDDATAGTIIPATDGAVANLTSEADLGWTGTLLINTGTKIRLTIAGGAHGSEYLVTVVAQCRAVVSGGYLA